MEQHPIGARQLALALAAAALGCSAPKASGQDENGEGDAATDNSSGDEAAGDDLPEGWTPPPPCVPEDIIEDNNLIVETQADLDAISGVCGIRGELRVLQRISYFHISGVASVEGLPPTLEVGDWDGFGWGKSLAFSPLASTRSLRSIRCSWAPAASTRSPSPTTTTRIHGQPRHREFLRGDVQLWKRRSGAVYGVPA